MNGKLHKQYLDSGISERAIALVMWSGFLLGSVAVDFDHFASLVFNNQALWAFLHQPLVTLFFIGLVFASLIGLRSSLVLRRQIEKSTANK